MRAGQHAVWQPFVVAAIAISLVAGFGIGTLLFISLLFDFGSGLWWPALAQAHGHAQLFGWAGLMVLGIGLYFLPRLASTPGVTPGWIRAGFWIFLAGLMLRVISRPAMAVPDLDSLRGAAELAWVAGVACELVGVLVLLAGLVRSILDGRSLPANPAVRSLLPLFAVGFLSLVGALATTLARGLSGLPEGDLPISRSASDYLILLTFYGFLLPISIAMSARLFPLYIRTAPPKRRLLLAGLVLLGAGIGARLTGDIAGIDALESAGRLLTAGAVASFAAGTRVFGSRRELPRRPMRLWQDVTGLHALSAYIWLTGAAVVQIADAGWQDVEFHLLGLGFVTLLIFGMGAHLIPGFGHATMRSPNYLWVTLSLGNLATICRAIPAIPGLYLPAAVEQACGALAGVAGLLALVFFSINISGVLTCRSAPKPAR